MLDKLPIVVQPSDWLPPPPSEEYCTVVFHLQGGRSTMGSFLTELSSHFEDARTLKIVKFEVGDHLRNRR
ncbi:hypothetical protein EKA85_29480 [Pseudomonas veronii]|jgi:hypothetical protein|uniref:Uncharacterized protein n=2 Tax=Pseudomonas TaxID=286 RepID=A0ABN5G8G5_PSEO1|nr:hypothetical protein [Pseudomonas sp. G11]AUO47202.1 hypothetical protein C1C98_17980 [Pseudomonas ogarae]KHK66661.1 hypothetical protein JZ00_02135 [Pseudomonas frederiksbergensis]MBD0702480.1 hypothetical protein [Pseudomonas sp. PSB1]PMU91956.1 hypothetical protein C1Y28_22025 [Pseudomonas sp. GW704-F5]PMU92480.1 hypothetical protein C1Y30_05160 [Pseudomonas sp. GW704-F3]PMV01502.1 hypothetical protein C1Y29_19395 [Pseudomonas sp. MPBD4-3]PMV34013.1 hypothetical protein C1Y27_09060 [Ps